MDYGKSDSNSTPVVLKGDLDKKAEHHSSAGLARKTLVSAWQKRHFVVYADGIVEYYNKGEKDTRQLVKIIDVTSEGRALDVTAIMTSGADMQTTCRVLHLRAPNDQQAGRWMAALQQAQAARCDFEVLDSPSQVQSVAVELPADTTGRMWSAGESYFQYQNEETALQWQLADSRWVIFLKPSGFVPAAGGSEKKGTGPLFIAGKIIGNLENQVREMYSTGARIAGYGNFPVWTLVSASDGCRKSMTQSLFFPDTNTILPRKMTFWESVYGGHNDGEGEYVVVQVGYHEKTQEDMDAAPEGKKKKYVGNGFYWQVRYDEFMSSNRNDDDTVWFTPIPVGFR